MKLWPARSKAQRQGPIADLDAIVEEPVYFRFKGKIHTLNPVALDEFLKFTNAQNDLMKSLASTDEKLTAEDLAHKYLAVIEPLCPSITYDLLMSMEQVQVAALYQLVIDMVTGQVDMGSGKKKRQKVDIYNTAQP